jgi:iron-sulfur cluster assembly protein
LGGRRRALITVTEHAREVLRSYERPEGTALRLDPANGHGPDGPLARLGFGEPRGDDQVVVDREGEEVLRIDRSVCEGLNGNEISVVSTLAGPGLDIREPTGTWPLPEDS